jgi:hypothetical protein
MAFVSMGGVVSAHSLSSRDVVTYLRNAGLAGKNTTVILSNVQVNVQDCKQVAPSEAKHVAATTTKQAQLCVYTQQNFSQSGKGMSTNGKAADPKSAVVLSNVQINIQNCKQVAASEAKHYAITATKQTQICVFAQKNTTQSGKPTDSNNTADTKTVLVLSNVQINIQNCDQVAASKASHYAKTTTKQAQVCIFAQKSTQTGQKPTDSQATDPKSNSTPQTQINVQSCKQTAASKASHYAKATTKQAQLCALAQKNASKKGHGQQPMDKARKSA